MTLSVSARLQPPRGTARQVKREDLMARLIAARRFRCVTISGPAGSGKTTALAAWRRALIPMGFEVAWLTAAPQDDEPARFLDAVIAALGQVDGTMAAEAALLCGGDMPNTEDIERVLVMLVRGIGAYGRELLLMIDDLHLLADPRNHAALQWLLDHAPLNLHLALVSRAPLPLFLSRLRAHRQVLELSSRDLRFSHAEVEQFLTLQLGEGAVDAPGARRWHQLTDGWVAGLQLMAMQWRRSVSRPPARARLSTSDTPLRDARAFASFFEREVFVRLSPDEMRMLVAMAVCERFCGALCATLVERPEQAGEAVARLARLESRNLFVSAMQETNAQETGETWYRLHPLLRETLLQRFAAVACTEQRSVHERAWRWFRDQGLMEEAVLHAVHAGKGDEAAELIERCAPSLFLRGDRGRIVALLRLLPPEQQQGRLGLRLWAMRVQFYMRETEACRRSMARLRQDVDPADTPAHFLIDVHDASLAVQCDDGCAARQVLPRLVHPPPGADPVAIGGSRNLRSWLHVRQGQYEAAREVQALPPLHVEGQPLICTAAGSLYGRCLAGLSYAMEGRMSEAERIHRSVLQEAEALGAPCADTALFAAALLGESLYELGAPQEVRDLLEPRVDAVERIGMPDAVLHTLRALSAACWLSGLRAQAMAWLERLEDHAQKQALPRLLAHSLAHQALRRIESGETLAAEACMERLDALRTREPGDAAGVMDEIGTLAISVRARWCVAQGDLDGAARRLRELARAGEASGRWREVARWQLEAAVVDSRRGLLASGRAQALAALRLGNRLGLLRTLADVGEAMPLVRVLAATDEETQRDPVLVFYTERLHAATASSAETGARSVRAGTVKRQPANLLEAFSGREVDMLRLLNQTMPNKKIARTLGLSPETVKWYLGRIYAKLGVSGRDEAVARVRDLGWERDLGGPF